MIISDEQVRRAVEYLKSCGARIEPSDACLRCDDDLVPKAVATAMAAPDVRDERLQQARYVVEGFLPDGETVAEKLIGRIISDSIR